MPDTPRANANTPPVEYDMRQDAEGWTIYDVTTDEPARVNGVPQSGLDMEAADDLMDLLTARRGSRRGACHTNHA